MGAGFRHSEHRGSREVPSKPSIPRPRPRPNSTAADRCLNKETGRLKSRPDTGALSRKLFVTSGDRNVMAPRGREQGSVEGVTRYVR